MGSNPSASAPLDKRDMLWAMPKDQYYDAALAYAQEHGFKGNTLPSYEAPNPPFLGRCPLERAIPGSSVGCTTITLPKGKAVEMLPKEVAIFVARADSGRFYKDLLGSPEKR